MASAARKTVDPKHELHSSRLHDLLLEKDYKTQNHSSCTSTNNEFELCLEVNFDKKKKVEEIIIA